MLWVSGTNPAVSLPELARIRQTLSQDRLFLVVQDIFLSETAQLADVVLPAATWGEKTGTSTNADRIVHLSEKAVEPPGEARPDLEIFLDCARRMGLRDKDAQPFPQWHDAESAFDAWAACSAGRPCDYTGLSHAKLREAPSGIQWPCTTERPEGTERLYTDGRFWSAPDYCEDYRRDLVTGAPLEETEYRALNPEVWVECCAADAQRLGIAEGDVAEVATPRGAIRAQVRISGIREGVLFVPLHYGYWDVTGPGRGHRRAANELTVTDWDPASKQPLFKTAATRLTRITAGDGRGLHPRRPRLVR